MASLTLPIRKPAARLRGRTGLGARAGLSLLTAALALSGCLSQDENVPPPRPEKAFLFSVNVSADYKAGSYSAFGIDSAFAEKTITSTHSDAVARYLGGDDIYVINRLGRDNLQVVDRHNLRTVLQFAFDALSNPYDVELKDSLLYVSFLGTDKIGVYDQYTGTSKGSIDLSAFADTSDKLPETSSLLFIDGDLYAITANLDTKNGWVPLTAHLLKIDVATRQVTRSLELPYGNPAGMSYDSASGKLYIPCRGLYSDETYAVETDGGIVGIDLASFTVADTLATELALGGNVNATQLYRGQLFMDLGTDAAEKIVAISLKDGKARNIVELGPYAVGDIAIDAPTASLFIADRSFGAASLRIFDADTFTERPESKVDLGMPPSSLAIIR
ncbi:MAG: hypothetical protein ABI036_02965 [Fibrobacteria bacterium]